MKCKLCGRSDKILGRPKKLNDARVNRLKNKGLGIRAIARHLGVTHGAIRASLERSKK